MILEKESEGTYCQIIKICGESASNVEKEIRGLIKDIDCLSVDILDQYGDISLVLYAKAEDEKEGKKLLKPIVRELKSRFGKNIYSTESNKTLEEAVVELLKAQGLTLSTAESCTGGMIAARIVNVAGASSVFCEGFVTYTEKAKRKRLLVKKSTLKSEGVVSAKTAKEMAKGGCFTSGADVCVSVTGCAGPEGGTKDKPVGTVFLGCCIKGEVSTQECHFPGNREQVREQATTTALIMLRECVLKTYKKK